MLGCAAFALARSFAGLTLARALIGVGVSACLMAPMTAFRRRFGAVGADARQLVDADDRLARHGGVDAAGAVAAAAGRLARAVLGWWRRCWRSRRSPIAWLVPRDAPAAPARAGAEADAGYRDDLPPSDVSCASRRSASSTTAA